MSVAFSHFRCLSFGFSLATLLLANCFLVDGSEVPIFAAPNGHRNPLRNCSAAAPCALARAFQFAQTIPGGAMVLLLQPGLYRDSRDCGLQLMLRGAFRIDGQSGAMHDCSQYIAPVSSASHIAFTNVSALAFTYVYFVNGVFGSGSGADATALIKVTGNSASAFSVVVTNCTFSNSSGSLFRIDTASPLSSSLSGTVHVAQSIFVLGVKGGLQIYVSRVLVHCRVLHDLIFVGASSLCAFARPFSWQTAGHCECLLSQTRCCKPKLSLMTATSRATLLRAVAPWRF